MTRAFWSIFVISPSCGLSPAYAADATTKSRTAEIPSRRFICTSEQKRGKIRASRPAGPVPSLFEDGSRRSALAIGRDLLPDDLLVPDHHDRGLLRQDVFLRHTLHVSRGDGVDGGGVAVQPVPRKAVQVHKLELGYDARPRRVLENERSREVRRDPLQLGRGGRFLLQPLDLAEDLLQRGSGDVGRDIGDLRPVRVAV